MSRTGAFHKAMVITAMLTLIGASTIDAAQRPVSPDVEAAAVRALASSVPLGSEVRIQTTSGRRMTATLLAIDEQGVTVKRQTRIPEPAVHIPYAELSRLQRHTAGNVNIAKAIGIGLASGAGAMLTLFAIVVAMAD